MYRESPPPAALPAAVRRLVRCGWESVEAGPKRIVPDGCVDLVAGGGEVFVAGPDTTAWTSVFPPGAPVRGLRFRPGAAAAALGVGADELRDSRVPLGRLWNRRGEALADRILSGADPGAELAAVLAEEVVSAQRLPDAEDPVVARMLAQLSATGRPGREQLAPAGRSERQVRRRFTLAVGYGPAVYRRVLRFQRAVALAPAAPSLAELAVAAGYADQPHLSRECRALTGLTPGAYFALRSGVSRRPVRPTRRAPWPRLVTLPPTPVAAQENARYPR
ncbi:helix-turn-helix domain-containing protein [Amycolatopsis benzoatilytica]|uniref:helix-turn-helix domain-containing protein n=1 Tax=Amycolatopsis benzoatilytica TaxID=346045 RepID=UPI0003811460|nr:helix-turn-helix domain-containing protein [Amycolatopsis benzoatilytica]